MPPQITSLVFYIWPLQTGVPTVSQFSHCVSLLKSINDLLSNTIWLSFESKCTLYPFTVVEVSIYLPWFWLQKRCLSNHQFDVIQVQSVILVLKEMMGHKHFCDAFSE
jgi:hypothetical protein